MGNGLETLIQGGNQSTDCQRGKHQRKAVEEAGQQGAEKYREYDLFIDAHKRCNLHIKQEIVNSEVVDSSTSDPIPEFRFTPICNTHRLIGPMKAETGI